MRIIIRYFNWCLKILIHFQIQILHVWKISITKYRKLEHQNSQNSDYLRFGGENGILANQLSKILKSTLLTFFIKIPKSPLKFIFLKRSPKSGEKRMVIFGGENGISRRKNMERFHCHMISMWFWDDFSRLKNPVKVFITLFRQKHSFFENGLKILKMSISGPKKTGKYSQK